ncbi:hypothetical protein Dsin_015955 [Dipteronia sinensis]|uniref:Secreted protein n=1 Tax=Dipteronia sinensis TaxID=43782 RepID=A0AAE0E561_9ROSI|nr:hypothetical protein Dsin_015955 [Dipteronia sinensis]
MGHWFSLCELGPWWLLTGLPVTSQELGRESPSRRKPTVLRVEVQREAGFTEQRVPPSPGSGRITGWCHFGPLASMRNGGRYPLSRVDRRWGGFETVGGCVSLGFVWPPK